MPVISLTMPEAILINTDAEFNASIWNEFKNEAVRIGAQVLSAPHFDAFNHAFEAAPISANNHHILTQVNNLLEREFPKHGAPLHFLLSTVPVKGGYDPLIQDHLFHHCLQYWAFIEKSTNTCAATCGTFLMNNDHEKVIWAGWLALAPEFRNQGIGKRLMEFVFSFCRIYAQNNGQEKLQFITSDEPHVKTARILYERQGCKITHSFPNPYVPGTNAIVMEWDIFKNNPIFSAK